MANCNKEFHDFNQVIRLTDAKRENLRTSRDACRETITNRFQKNGIETMPEFQGQGSYVTDTITNPIKGDYDLDDGVYFIGDRTADQRATPEQFHKAIVAAVQDQTNEVTDKDTCVRVRYAAGYHIDLPIYYASYLHPELAHKKKGWILSDPLEFIEWFEHRAGTSFNRAFLLEAAKEPELRKWAEDVRKDDVQLRRIVRYFKAWADNQGRDKMPSGICLTILATVNFAVRSNDDEAFFHTAAAMLKKLSVTFECLRPTTPVGDDLFAGYTHEQRNYFMDRLAALVHDGWNAIEAPYTSEACAIWRKHLGGRYKCVEPVKDPAFAVSLGNLAKQAKPYRR